MKFVAGVLVYWYDGNRFVWSCGVGGMYDRGVFFMVARSGSGITGLVGVFGGCSSFGYSYHKMGCVVVGCVEVNVGGGRNLYFGVSESVEIKP